MIMYNIQILIAQYTMKVLVQEIDNLYREKFNYAAIKPLPRFSDLIETFLKKCGLECRARSSSGNGCNYSSDKNWPYSGYNYYVPLRPEMENYLSDMQNIVLDQASKQNLTTKQILNSIFEPLQQKEGWKYVYKELGVEKIGIE